MSEASILDPLLFIIFITDLLRCQPVNLWCELSISKIISWSNLQQTSFLCKQEVWYFFSVIFFFHHLQVSVYIIRLYQHPLSGPSFKLRYDQFYFCLIKQKCNEVSRYQTLRLSLTLSETEPRSVSFHSNLTLNFSLILSDRFLTKWIFTSKKSRKWYSNGFGEIYLHEPSSK